MQLPPKTDIVPLPSATVSLYLKATNGFALKMSSAWLLSRALVLPSPARTGDMRLKAAVLRVRVLACAARGLCSVLHSCSGVQFEVRKLLSEKSSQSTK